MSLFIRQDDQRSELQTRIAAELQAKAREKAKEADLPDGVTDSAYVKGTKQTSRLGWIWAIVLVAVVGVIIFLVATSL